MVYINSNKINNLSINENNVYLAIDFDKTITANESDDSWNVSGLLLGDEFSYKSKCLYERFRPIELDYSLDFYEKERYMIEWYSSVMDLFFEYSLTKEKLYESVLKSNLVFRSGVKEFLNECYNKNIPIVILSAGIGNVIEIFLKRMDCYFSNIHIISNFIDFDNNGNIKKFDNSTMVHTLNKTMNNKLPQFFLEKLKSKTYKILVGDLREDENMIDPSQWDTTLKIGILDREIQERLKIYNSAFDLVLTSKDASFEILNKIIFSHSFKLD